VRIPAALVCIATLALPAAALARSPLKPADMKTIRGDARTNGATFAHVYKAKRFTIACRKRTPYAARCAIRMIGVPGRRHDCIITTVYVVTRDHKIAADLGRDGCS
jgi:hypothetical protein